MCCQLQKMPTDYQDDKHLEHNCGRVSKYILRQGFQSQSSLPRSFNCATLAESKEQPVSAAAILVIWKSVCKALYQ